MSWGPSQFVSWNLDICKEKFSRSKLESLRKNPCFCPKPGKQNLVSLPNSQSYISIGFQFYIALFVIGYLVPLLLILISYIKIILIIRRSSQVGSKIKHWRELSNFSKLEWFWLQSLYVGDIWAIINIAVGWFWHRKWWTFVLAIVFDFVTSVQTNQAAKIRK